MWQIFILSVGHCHPRVTQTVQLQLACFGTGSPINPDQIPDGPWKATKYSKRLLENLPKKFDTVLFFASGYFFAL
jgi:4-aminobutyrate aminotransferase-like enzyme